MPFDGVLAYNMVKELNTLLAGGRINKIYQMNKDSVLLHIRAKGNNYSLFLSCNASAARIHITDKQFENPDTPPVFCMLLRKHLSGGIISSFSTEGFERIITMEVGVTDELGDRNTKKLVIEVMGRHSNIILLTKDNKIIDSIKHVDFSVNRVREILPARTYILPPTQDKLQPDDPSTYNYLINEAPVSERKISSFLLDKLQGFSPVLCREVCFRAGIDDDRPANSLTSKELHNLIHVLENMMEQLNNSQTAPSIVFDESTNKVIDFHCIKLKQYRTIQSYNSISQAIDTFYTLKNSKEFYNQRAFNMLKLVEKHLEKVEKRLGINLRTYEENKNFDDYRLYGELITANIYSLKKGMDSATLVNYYSKTGDMIDIPLDIYKSPQENAQLYFKKYNKSRTAYAYAKKEIGILKSEISYLESVIFAIESAQTPEQLNQIRTELYEQGYLNQPRKKNRKAKATPVLPLKIQSEDGFEILIGRNNKENDKLTLKIARKDDIWLHIKNFPGSHVVIRTEGREVPDSTLAEAAQYAAWFSKARTAPKTEIDYTLVRNVKKPSGSKPGMVIYVDYKTILVEPREPIFKEPGNIT